MENKTEVQIVIPPMNIQSLELVVVGDSELIIHKWSEKAKKAMLDKQMHNAVPAKAAKNPEQDFFDSLYWLTKKPAKPKMADLAKAKFGFPAVGFKAAAVNACSFVEGVTKVVARGMMHINQEFIEIESDAPRMREDMVRVGMGTADLRYRGGFEKWRATLPISYNANVISAEQIANLFELAGFAIGVGEWRPPKNGDFGRFHVARKGE